MNQVKVADLTGENMADASVFTSKLTEKVKLIVSVVKT
jgi:hypothetical protein